MNDRHRQIQRIKKKYKHLAAAAMLGAVIMSSAGLPGIPSPTAHAASINNSQVVTAQQNINMNKLNNPVQAGSIINTPAVKPLPIQKVNRQVNPSQSNKIINTPVTLTPPAVSTNPIDKPEVKPNPDVKPTEDKTVVSKDKPAVSEDKPAVSEDKPVVSKDEQISSDKPPVESKQAIEVVATAYAPGPNDNDQWGDKTYMGTTVRPGVIAVDPKVIPLGSRVYIQYPDGHGEYAVAEDTGGAIKGNRIDIAMGSDSKANDFGMQKVKVYIVGKA